MKKNMHYTLALILLFCLEAPHAYGAPNFRIFDESIHNDPDVMFEILPDFLKTSYDGKEYAVYSNSWITPKSYLYVKEDDNYRLSQTESWYARNIYKGIAISEGYLYLFTNHEIFYILIDELLIGNDWGKIIQKIELDSSIVINGYMQTDQNILLNLHNGPAILSKNTVVPVHKDNSVTLGGSGPGGFNFIQRNNRVHLIDAFNSQLDF